MSTPSQVLLVGSIPLSSSEEVFRTATKALPNRLNRLPDGETGVRHNFVAWQYGVFPVNIIQAAYGGQPPAEKGNFNYTVADLKPTGYDDVALASYAVFSKLQEEKIIPPHVRFQACLPTPLGVVRAYIESPYCAEIEPHYENILLQAVRRIQDNIPHEKLAIQWDIPFEVGMLEHEKGKLTEQYRPYFPDARAGILERLARLAQNVAPNVEMGYHLCYGDLGHVHFVEPDDMSLMVSLANDIYQCVSPIHSIAYMHMPVPKTRTDDAYFKPLQSLALDDNTRLYLGVVHPHDEEGTKARLDAAKKVYSRSIGIGSECGLGRTPKDELDSILAISAQAV